MTSPVYDTIGRGYVAHRRPDPRWAAVLADHLGAGEKDLVVNVGAGTGSYEPVHCPVVAVEPSRVMVDQRPAGAGPAVRAGASALPLPSGRAAVALAILTVHHWDDPAAGLAELCRVAPRRVVVGIDFEAHSRFWLLEERRVAASAPRPLGAPDGRPGLPAARRRRVLSISTRKRARRSGSRCPVGNTAPRAAAAGGPPQAATGGGRCRWLRSRLWNPQSSRPFSWVVGPPSA